MKVSDILAIKGAAAATIGPDETIGELARRLVEKRIGALMVSRDGVSLDGIVSERDVVYGLAKHGDRLRGLPVSDLMTKNVVTCRPGDSLAEVSRVMSARHIRHLPVMDGARLAGIISIRDVLKSRLDQMQRHADVLREYVMESE